MKDVDNQRPLRAVAAFFNRTDYVLALVIFATMAALLTSFKIIRSDQYYGDTAMYFQATENIAGRGVAVSQVKASIDGVASSYFTSSAEQIAKDPSPLFGGPTEVTERSLLLGHAYFILFPIALLVRFFPVNIVLMSLYVLSFVSIVVLCYYLIRSKGISIAGACLFCLLVISQPAWSAGLLVGQFYPDRLFILTGFILMVLVSRNDPFCAATLPSRAWLLVVAVTCALINERGALIAGIFLLAYVGLYWSKPGLDRYFKIMLGTALVCYGYIILKLYVPTNTAYHSFLPSTPSGLLSFVQTPNFVPLVTLFLLVSAPLLFLALFEWRAAVIAALLMLPNIFGNIGGAEKTGWSTHYPSFYFPALVWAAMSGYVALTRIGTSRRFAGGLYLVTGAAIVFLWALNPYHYPLDVSIANVSSSFLPDFESEAGTFILKKGARESLTVAQDSMKRTIPPHSVVSSVEAGLTLLYPHRTMEFYPADIDHADYAVLGGHVVDGKMNYYGAVSYNGTAERNKINALAVERLKRDGYDIEHPALFPAFNGLAVVRRTH